MQTIQIGNRPIGRQHKPFIIAELSGNHQQSLDKALSMVEAAAKSGAHAIKLQTYTPDTMTLEINAGEFFIDDENSLWQGSSLHQLYQQAMTPWEWHRAIFDHAAKLGLIAFSTPFDCSAVDFLETLQVPCHKIASFENIDHALLRKVAATGKPVIMSTGIASLAELAESVEVLRDSGCDQLILLKCTSAYPAPANEANVRTLPHLAELFQCQTGLSDHTLGIGVAIASVALGATVIEKHFVLDRSGNSVDAAFSLEPSELAQLVTETERAWLSLGQINYGATEKEIASRQHRRSLYVCKDLRAGDILTEDNLRSIRPGLGLAPKHLQKALGKPVRKDVPKGTPLNWDLF